MSQTAYTVMLFSSVTDAAKPDTTAVLGDSTNITVRADIASRPETDDRSGSASERTNTDASTSKWSADLQLPLPASKRDRILQAIGSKCSIKPRDYMPNNASRV